ncbi:unnamed protein product [Diatraea saccharalis]|uniref:Uncharacterized protein n=1 Tax=Diatraea saccharalis TaxID=40085 RepID=A0A9N9N0V4_9NEOP|nr:unnamed protein product [Diatraea saccharalis]
MERFPLKSSTPKMTTTYQSVYKKGSNTNNGRNAQGSSEDDMVDITPGLQRAADSTPTSHGTFQLYEHTGAGDQRHSSASANSYIAQYFSSSTGKRIVL